LSGLGVPRNRRHSCSTPSHTVERNDEKTAAVVLYVLVLVAVVVAVDILFFKHQFWERLSANVLIVVAFAALYLKFLKRRWAQRPQEAATKPR
jgi:protein-S-isoprenylcysteine O-methyltransferase Ste14